MAQESQAADPAAPTDVCIFGTGEYTTGWVGESSTKSDKKCGVVGLVMFDLRKRGRVGPRIGLCGTNGSKFPQIRQFMREAIEGAYKGLSTRCETFPSDDTRSDPRAYLGALEAFRKGDSAIVFTPDDSHFDIAMAAVRRGLHVMVTKPIVKTLEHHIALLNAANEAKSLVCVEVHKRFDPIYADARSRIQSLGDFGYFVSYMSQPKIQLQTFKAWAGRASDISFYLNSHHVDFLCWALQDIAIPITVTATASTGVAKREIGVDCEDTITLQVQWRNIASGNLGTSVFTASWAAAKSDVHSQQRFFYLGHGGEVTVDQAHRGYTVATDQAGFASCNPLYFRYTPDASGEFAGQDGYGYKSLALFIDAVNSIRRGERSHTDFDRSLATVGTTLRCTAILEAGRRSLDSGGARVSIEYDEHLQPSALKVAS